MPWLLLAVLVAVALAKRNEGGAAAAATSPALPAAPPVNPSFLDWAPPGQTLPTVPGQVVQPQPMPGTTPGFTDWAPGQGRTLDETNTGQAIALAVGEPFTVRLPSSSATGYTWTLIQGDPSVIAQQGEPAGGTVYTFKGVGAGSTRLVLGLVRPWEPEAAPARTWELDVTVSAGAGAQPPAASSGSEDVTSDLASFFRDYGYNEMDVLAEQYAQARRENKRPATAIADWLDSHATDALRHLDDEDPASFLHDWSADRVDRTRLRKLLGEFADDLMPEIEGRASSKLDDMIRERIARLQSS